MYPDPDARIDADPESDDLVARARAAVLEMRRQAVASGLEQQSEAGEPGEGESKPKRRRRRKGEDRAA
jgi:hypothetical protein